MRSGVDVKLFYELKEVLSATERRSRERCIYDNRNKTETRIDVDAILVNIGFRADLGPIKEWGLEIVGREITRDRQDGDEHPRGLRRWGHRVARGDRQDEPDRDGVRSGRHGRQRREEPHRPEREDIPGPQQRDEGLVQAEDTSVVVVARDRRVQRVDEDALEPRVLSVLP